MNYLEQLNQISSIPGIYMLVNNINEKKYIGQSLNLKKRLKKHYLLHKENRYDAPLYKAFSKYGIDNFTIIILYQTDNKNFKEVKRTLDELELKYIEEYGSYGQYNQTRGGDGGVLGYKFSEPQKAHLLKTVKDRAYDGRYMIYIYDVIDNCYYTFVNSKVAETVLGVNSASLRGSQRYPSPYMGKYLVSKTKDGLQEKMSKIQW